MVGGGLTNTGVCVLMRRKHGCVWNGFQEVLISSIIR